MIDAGLYAILSVTFEYVVLGGTDSVRSTAVSDTVSKVGHPASEKGSQEWHRGNYILFIKVKDVS